MLQFTIREPGSAITHFIACLVTAMAASPLLIKAKSGIASLAMLIFILSMIFLYAASELYHTVAVPENILTIFKKIDHMMIFVLIAGSYTPVCLIALGGKIGYTLLGFVWGIAIIGMLIKFFWVYCPKWFSSLLYISMGWICLLVFGPLWNSLPHVAFGWLFAGGVIYTVGGIIYALKLPIFNKKHKYFGSHEIFHLFVMGGSICHFIFMYQYLA